MSAADAFDEPPIQAEGAAEASNWPPIQTEVIRPAYENPSNPAQNVHFSNNPSTEQHPGFLKNSSYEQNIQFAQNVGYDRSTGIVRNTGCPVPQGPVVVQTFLVQPSVKLSYQPVHTTCPSCRQQILTKVTYKTGALTWLSCCGIMLAGCFCGCCLIPFFVDSLKNTLHHCPTCGCLIGICKPI
ncbi:lipopolysaccharide-induced tumor necrosis factor-alpha factor homolog isoform X2 [Protopterus annectens]|nr:lipopolysaccharide-induced tumor necrosis factor-alpha factor homolog isoform X2 [Protopterus annectens]